MPDQRGSYFAASHWRIYDVISGGRSRVGQVSRPLKFLILGHRKVLGQVTTDVLEIVEIMLANEDASRADIWSSCTSSCGALELANCKLKFECTPLHSSDGLVRDRVSFGAQPRRYIEFDGTIDVTGLKQLIFLVGELLHALRCRTPSPPNTSTADARRAPARWTLSQGRSFPRTKAPTRANSETSSSSSSSITSVASEYGSSGMGVCPNHEGLAR